MIKTYLTKFFPFSASYSANNKVYAHNYILGLTTGDLDRSRELDLVKRVEEGLIQKINSRDLGKDTEFFRDVVITESLMLRKFFDLLENSVKPIQIIRLTLERDSKTTFTLTADVTSF